jgi:hypothetical protein
MLDDNLVTDKLLLQQEAALLMLMCASLVELCYPALGIVLTIMNCECWASSCMPFDLIWTTTEQAQHRSADIDCVQHYSFGHQRA